MYCEVQQILSYVSCAYLLASLFYLLITACYGTPFKNAIKKYPELESIKKYSASIRYNAFLISLVISIIILLVLRPFKLCHQY